MSEFFLDPGATRHFCADRSLLSEYESFNDESRQVEVANGQFSSAVGSGSIYVRIKHGHVLKLKDVWHMPSIIGNFISVKRMARNGLKVVFPRKYASVYFDGMCIIRVSDIGSQYTWLARSERLLAISDRSIEIAFEWHLKLGHLNVFQLKPLLRSLGLTCRDKLNCVVCLKVKLAAKPHATSNTRAERVLGTVHSDVVGPFRVRAVEGYKYFVTIVDNYSRHVSVYGLKLRSDLYNVTQSCIQWVENQRETKIKIDVQPEGHRAPDHGVTHAPTERSCRTDEPHLGRVIQVHVRVQQGLSVSLV